MLRKGLITVALMAVAANGAFAQRGGGGGMGRGGGMGGGFPMAAPASKADEIAKELKLNKDQKAELETILNEARTQAQPLVKQIDDARVLIVQAYVAKQPSDEAVKKLAAVHAQMVAVEAGALAKILAKLPDKQKAKAPKAFELMAGMFQAPAMGGMPGRGRGGR